MSASDKRTVLRTLRIPMSLYEILKKDARDKGSNLNALAIGVLNKYAEWDRIAERFGIVSFSREVLKGILDSTNNEKLLKAAKLLGSRTPKAGVMFWFKEANAETFLAGLSNLFKYGRIGECETLIEGTKHVVVIRHDLGIKWSRFLGSYLDSAAASVLGTNPRFELSPSMVSMRF